MPRGFFVAGADVAAISLDGRPVQAAREASATLSIAVLTSSRPAPAHPEPDYPSAARMPTKADAHHYRPLGDALVAADGRDAKAAGLAGQLDRAWPGTGPGTKS